MTTRRNILKGGAGLAAILASGKAPAYLIKSMVASRGSFLGRGAGGGGWVNPYVTDGLVAMWDGEWNAGWGIHDANATVWNDLAGSGDMPTTLSTLSWEPDALVRTGVNGFSFVPPIDLSDALSPRTFELVMSAEGLPDNATTTYYIWRIESAGIRFTVQNTNNVMFTLRASAGMVDTGERTPNVPKTYFAMVRTGDYFSSDRNVAKYYKNGQNIANGAFGGNATDIPSMDIFAAVRNWPQTNTMRFNSFRIYSRALTAAEIAANYAVDKQRFNLA